MQSSASISSLSAALIAAQSEFPAITRDKEVEVKTKNGATYKFKYAPLDSIIEKVRPVLSKHKLAFIQSAGDKNISTRLVHSSGEWLETDAMPVLASSGSAQDYGSGITYARRYQLAALLGIASEDDDDANRAAGNELKARGARAVAVDAWEAIPAARREAIQRHILDTTALVTEGRIIEAAEYFYRDSGMSQDEILGAWSQMDSKTRGSVKQGEAAIQLKAKGK